MAGASTPAIDLAKAYVMAPVAWDDYLILTPLIVPFLAAALVVILRDRTRTHAWIAGMAFALVFLSNCALFWHVLRDGPLVMTMGKWLPPFGISFTADITGVPFALSTSIIALGLVPYASSTIDQARSHHGFYAFFLLLVAGVSAAFLTADLFNLYVWFEVLLISSFGLLILGGEKEQLDGGIKYAFLNLIATTLFLIAVAYIYGLTGALNMADLAVKMRDLGGAAPAMTLACLFCLAFTMKAAAFPVNFWLPASYHTPSMVAAALFAGLLTKIGIYALIRVLIMIMPQGGEALQGLLLVVGCATILMGGLGALAQSDMRRMLGYCVISGIGAMLIGIGLQDNQGLAGTLLYALHSMMVMTALYVAVGIASYLTQNFSMMQGSGLYRSHPFFAALVLVLVFALSGLPPFSGFWPKLLLLYSGLQAGQIAAMVALLVGTFLTMMAMGRFWLFVFWHPVAPAVPVVPLLNDNQPVAVVERRTIPNRMMASLLLFTGLSVALGIAADYPSLWTLEAASSLLNPTLYLDSVLGAQP
jgi:multicomponent Na+:H+ antiporter subunit D